MPKCTDAKIDSGRFGRRVIEADFSGGDLSSDGGLLLLRQVDEHLGLGRAAAAASPDPRDPERITNPLRDLVLDIDASDVPLHGAQELGAFHAYCDHHC